MKISVIPRDLKSVKRFLPDFWAILALFVLWILFFWRVWTPIENDQLSFAEGDFSGQFVAWTDYAVERLDQGEIPLWNPYQYAGAPFQADPQTALTYPPRMLTLAALLIQSEVQPYEVYAALQREVMLHVLLASWFVYALLRRLLSTSAVWGGLAAAVTYAYGGYVAGYPILQVPLLEAGIWLPLVLLGILEATPQSTNTAVRWRWLLFSAVMLGLCLLAGHPQTALFTLYAAVAYLGWRVYQQRRGWQVFIAGVIFLGMVSGALSAVQILPAAEFSLHTSRVDMTFEAKGGGFSFAELSNILFPLRGELWNANYLGLVALMLMGIAIWRRVPDWGFFTALFGVSFVLSFGQQTALYGILYPILPGLALFRGQERIMFLMAHSTAVLVGLGTSHILTWQTRDLHLKKPIRQTLLFLLAICAGVAAVCFLISLTDYRTRAVEDRLTSAAFSGLLLAAMLLGLNWFFQQPREKFRMAALIGLLAFDLFSANAMLKLNYEPVPVHERIAAPAFPNAFNKNERVDTRNGIRDGYSTLYRLLDISGSDPLQLAPIRTYLEDIPTERQWEILAVSQVVSRPEELTRLEDPRPFAHPVYGYYRVTSDDEAYGFLREPAFDVRHLALLEANPGALPDTHLPDKTHSVTITRFEPEHIELQAVLPDNAILTLALPDYPGWQAQVDGQEATILRNYGGLSAVYVPAGIHTVSLQFAPRWFPAGISGLAWGLVLIVALVILLRNRAPQRD